MRDCVSAFASRDWTVVAKGAIPRLTVIGSVSLLMAQAFFDLFELFASFAQLFVVGVIMNSGEAAADAILVGAHVLNSRASLE